MVFNFVVRLYERMIPLDCSTVKDTISKIATLVKHYLAFLKNILFPLFFKHLEDFLVLAFH